MWGGVGESVAEKTVDGCHNSLVNLKRLNSSPRLHVMSRLPEVVSACCITQLVTRHQGIPSICCENMK